MGQYDRNSPFNQKEIVMGTCGNKPPVFAPAKPTQQSPQSEVLSEQIRRERAQMRAAMKREQGWLV